MNGFANATLTLLLGWLKSLISNLWALLNSEGSGTFYHFLANHWKAVVLVLCVGGVVADGMIYLFRWRPYYVWRSKLHRLTRRRKRRAQEAEMPPDDAPSQAPYAPPEPQPAPNAIANPPFPAYAAASAYDAGFQAAPVEPVFEHDVVDWDSANEEAPMNSTFGMPQPEPLMYLRDMQAGFARPLPPEQLYPQPAHQNPFDEPVHPGLNDEALRNSFGISSQPSEEFWTMDAPQEAYSQEAYSQEAYPQEAYPQETYPQEVYSPKPVMRAPEFRPFTEKPAQEPPRHDNPFARLAKKARGLVGVEDEDSRPTLRDLHSTVDVTSAFHEPVYPQPRHQQGGEE